MNTKRTASFLYNAINTLPNDAQFNAIRSQMMLKCRQILSITQEDFPSCTVCGVNFKEIRPHRKIIPTHHEKNRFLKRQLGKDEYYRTKYQALYIKKSVKRNYNKQQLITVCQQCKRQYKTQIAKPKLVLTSKRDFKSSETTSIKKSKKKKKKKYAGLKKSAVLEAKQHFINSNTELEESPNYLSLNTPKQNDIIIINDSPKNTNDSVILLDTPVSNKKAHKSKSKFEPTHHSPKIENDTKQDKKKKIVTYNNSIEILNASIEPLKASKRKRHSAKYYNRQDFVEKTPTVVLLAMEKKSVNKSKKMNALTNLLSKKESAPKLKSTLETFLQNI